ncbi:subtilase-type protease inhibitor [Actinophytocola gossypii]|uniref:Serine protease n=1 Tax=Actinophytocola gossypii TaxID=2812003 RepID=A0ABT2J404_9PSEU|nr:subtilase-type protease inhibitor [Actinophytocola gossypii]MCT2582597.1 serine protease [Actinophytocola gossypii]
MTSLRLGGVLLAAAALLSTATATAAAEPGTSSVTLVVHAKAGTTDVARLQCEPAGGSHPDPDTACAELIAANGDFAELEGQQTMCTMELNPVTARANGVWDGETIDWQQEFSNPCVLIAATGSVFDF